MFHVKIFITVSLAVVITLGLYEWYNIKRSEKYLAAAYISEGFQKSMVVKMYISQYFSEKDKLPSSNTELGIPEPASFKGNALDSIEVTANGIITLKYNKMSGVSNGVIYLVPDVSNSISGIAWQCSTPSFNNIESWAPQCKFVP